MRSKPLVTLGLVVILRARTLTELRAKKAKQTAQKVAVADMHLDAVERGLVHTDDRTWDHTEEHQELIEAWGAETVARELREKAMVNRSYLNKSLEYKKKFKTIESDASADAPEYRSSKKITKQAAINAPNQARPHDPNDPAQNQSEVVHHRKMNRAVGASAAKGKGKETASSDTQQKDAGGEKWKLP